MAARGSIRARKVSGNIKEAGEERVKEQQTIDE